MALSDRHREAAEDALSEARRNPVMSAEQWFRAAEIHALLAIEARLAQLVHSNDERMDFIATG